MVLKFNKRWACLLEEIQQSQLLFVKHHRKNVSRKRNFTQEKVAYCQKFVPGEMFFPDEDRGIKLAQVIISVSNDPVQLYNE